MKLSAFFAVTVALFSALVSAAPVPSKDPIIKKNPLKRIGGVSNNMQFAASIVYAESSPQGSQQADKAVRNVESLAKRLARLKPAEAHLWADLIQKELRKAGNAAPEWKHRLIQSLRGVH
jgi:hypothetical protein